MRTRTRCTKDDFRKVALTKQYNQPEYGERKVEQRNGRTNRLGPRNEVVESLLFPIRRSVRHLFVVIKVAKNCKASTKDLTLVNYLREYQPSNSSAGL